MKKVLFVCTGNTCRSPMAEAIFRLEVDKNGLTEEITVESAGLAAFDGEAASENAIEVMKEIGIDISEKRSQRLNMELLLQSDLIVCVSQEHKNSLSHFQDIISDIMVLEVSDPYGQNRDVYRKTRDEIAAKVKEIFEDIKNEQGE